MRAVVWTPSYGQLLNSSAGAMPIKPNRACGTRRPPWGCSKSFWAGRNQEVSCVHPASAEKTRRKDPKYLVLTDFRFCLGRIPPDKRACGQTRCQLVHRPLGIYGRPNGAMGSPSWLFLVPGLLAMLAVHLRRRQKHPLRGGAKRSPCV